MKYKVNYADLEVRICQVEVNNVKQMKTLLPSLIPASKMKEQRERPWHAVESLGFLHLLTKLINLLSNLISLNSQNVHGINKVTISLFILRVLCTQRFLWVWTRLCLHSM